MATGALSSRAVDDAAACASPLNVGSACAVSVRPMDCEVIGLEFPVDVLNWASWPQVSTYRHILLFEHPYRRRMRHMLRGKKANCVATVGSGHGSGHGAAGSV